MEIRLERAREAEMKIPREIAIGFSRAAASI